MIYLIFEELASWKAIALMFFFLQFTDLFRKQAIKIFWLIYTASLGIFLYMFNLMMVDDY